MKIQRQNSALGESHKSGWIQGMAAAIVVLIISTLLVGACSRTGAPSNNKKDGAAEPEIEFTEARLAKVDGGKLVERERLSAISKDFSAYVYVVNENGKHRVKVNDKDWGIYEKVLLIGVNARTREPLCVVEENGNQRVCAGRSCGQEFKKVRSVTLSPDGSRLAYIGTEAGTVSSNDYLMVDGDKVGPYLDIDSFAFSPDGSQIAAKVTHENRWKALHNGKLSEGYYWVSTPVFNPATNVLAYAANKKNGQQEDLHVVVGNERGRNFDSIGPPVFSPSGRSVAYLAGQLSSDPESFYKSKFVVRNTEPGKRFAELMYGPVWSPGNERLGYIAKVKERKVLESDKEYYFVVIDDREYGPYKGALPSIVFSRDGQHFMAGVVDQKGEAHMLVDGELKGSYTNIYSYFFTDDQSDRVSIATDKDKNEPGVYIGDQRLNVAIPPSPLAYSFSKDGKKVAFVKDENGEVWRRIVTLR
jgi:hypothetical protein